MADMNLTLSRKLARHTNIMDVKVPAALERSVPLAKDGHRVAFMNEVFGGTGATPSSSNLFTGMPGAGKTTLLLQMADALTAQGHFCLFNGNEEAVVQVRKTVRRLGLKHGFICGNDVMVADLLDHAKELCEAAKGKKAKDGSPVQVFIIVDSLQTMDDGMYANGHTNSNTPLRVVEMITEFCKTPQAVSHERDKDAIYPIAMIIGHVTKAGDFAGKQSIKHTVDSHMHLRIDIDPKSDTCGKRLIGMTKNRFSGCGIEYCLNMTSKGLVEDGSF